MNFRLLTFKFRPLIACAIFLAPPIIATSQEAARAPLLEGIGALEFTITTDNTRSQAYFNQAMTLSFGFNHAEAVRSFQEAARLDPSCGICYAGIALALGPNINAPMNPEAVRPAWEAAQTALKLSKGESGFEQDFIEAIATRYSEGGTDRAALDAIYAGTMSGLAKKYPKNNHVITLYAESLMDLTPWSYWNEDKSPKVHTVTIVELLERVIEASPDQIGAMHLYIHVMERFFPEKALAAADQLGGLVPVAGHLVHMPSHIYLRVGRYADAILANQMATIADEDYISQCNAQGLYPAAYYPHNIHFLWYSAMTEARKSLTIESAIRLKQKVPLDVAKGMGVLQSYLSAPIYTYLRFGMWKEMLSLKPPSEDLPFALAIHYYGTGIASASLGDKTLAINSLSQLEKISASKKMGSVTIRFPGVRESLLDIASSLVKASIERIDKNSEKEILWLQKAVVTQDQLPYTEPPLWHYPVRQNLGTAQLRSGLAQNALGTFTLDLKEFPKNPWSLFGLEQAELKSGITNNSTRESRIDSWKNSDIDPTTGWN